MSNELSSPTEADFGRVFEDVVGLKQQIKNLELDTASLKAENMECIKKWGVYLGVLASAVAVRKAAKETLDTWYYLLWTSRPIESAVSNQTVVLAVTADPIPHNPISIHDRKGTVLQADANRVDVIFAFQLFELQTGVCRVGLEDTV